MINIKPIKINNKYYIETYTKEFGNVLLFQDNSIFPLSFSTKEECVLEIQKRSELNESTSMCQ